MRMSVLGRAYRFIGAVALLALACSAISQSQQSATQRSVRFGDIILRNFVTAEVELGVVAKVTGPGTTVDASDADRHTTAQVRAREITAYMVRNKSQKPSRRDLGRVERIEAVGSVTFTGTSKPEGEPPVDVRATGTKAVYDRTAMQLTLLGPVTFSAEQPDPSGQGKDYVNGKAQRAVYDEGKRILKLFGDVQATVITPDMPPEGSTFSGDEVSVDMSGQPYRVYISNPSMSGAINIKVREPEKPKSEEKGR